VSVVTLRKKGNAPERENAHLEYRMEGLTDPDIVPERCKKDTFLKKYSINIVRTI